MKQNEFIRRSTADQILRALIAKRINRHMVYAYRIAVISKALGHKSLSSTLHYIGATQAKADDFADKYSLEELV